MPRRPHIPRERSPLVGRERELAELRRLLEEGTRLVTLHGPPGIGKSRLAARLLRDARGQGYELARRADLEGVRSLEDMLRAVAQAVAPGQEAEAEPAEVIADALQGRRALLVLDGCEGLPPEAAEQVGALIDRVDGLDVVAASRARLGIEGELTIEVGPLPPAAAAALFRLCARAVRPAARGADADAGGADEEVERLVELLDRIPLAIELAAARAAVLAPGEMLARLQAGAPFGQDALRAAIAWSYSLLRPFEQRAFAQSSLFRGGFSLAAAERVLALPAGSPPVLEVLRALLNQALISATATEQGATRFVLYESLRRFGEEQLRALGEEEAAARRHAAYYRTLGQGEPVGYAGVDTRRALGELAVERDNLLVAFRRSLAGAPEDAVALGLVLDPLLLMTGPLGLHTEVLGAAAALAERRGAHAARIDALRALGRTHGVRGEVRRAEEVYREAIALARERGSRAQLASLLSLLAHVLSTGERLGEARALAEEARALVPALADPRQEAFAEKALGVVARAEGRLEESAAHLRRATAIARRVQADRLLALAMANLSDTLADLGDLGAARAALGEGQAGLAALGDRLHLAALAHREVALLRRLGRPAEAEALALATLPKARELGDLRTEATLQLELCQLALDAADLPRAERALDDAQELMRGLGDRHLRVTAAELARRMAGRRSAGPVLALEGDCEAFAVGAARVELRGRPRLQRVLRALVAQHAAAPGVGLAVHELFAAAWPGERAHPSSVSARVYMAVKTLRALGLRAVLLTRDDGYLLSPALRVRREPMG